MASIKFRTITKDSSGYALRMTNLKIRFFGLRPQINSFELLKNSNLSPFRLTIYKKWYKTYKITKTKELFINNYTV